MLFSRICYRSVSIAWFAPTEKKMAQETLVQKSGKNLASCVRASNLPDGLHCALAHKGAGLEKPELF